MSQLLDDPLRRAREALDAHDWAEAYRCLSQADAALELDAPTLELLGQAAHLAGHLDAAVAAWERAHGAHVRAGAPLAAAAAAIRAALLELDAGSLARSNGWLMRAERLLEGQPESPVHGWLAAVHGVAAFLSGDAEAVLADARKAAEFGERFGDAALQAVGLHWQGRALVLRGEVEEGLALLDETTALALSGALDPVMTGYMYCSTVCASQGVADYRRAEDWTAAMHRWCERNKIAAFPGMCRAHRAELLRLRGDWSEAEGQARQAAEELREFSALDSGWPLHELGLVRLRMGDLDGAEEIFMEALTLGRVPQPGLALAQLAHGDIELAAASIAEVLDNPPETSLSWEAPLNTLLGRATLLPAQVEISVASEDLDVATAAAEELERTADAFGTRPLRASAAWARGKVQLARGDPSSARKSFQSAVAMWAEVQAPYELARARMGLGEAYRAAGNEASALLEFRAAHMAFERLGARLDARQAGAALAEAPETRRERKTFMFTDIVGSTNLLEALGDEAWGHILRWHNDTLGELVASHHGEVLHTTGDGLFAVFDDPADALTCGVAIQRTLQEHRLTAGFAPLVRIGVHAAEATEEGHDFHGRGVHVAARVGALAEGGEVLTTRETLVLAGDAFTAERPRTVTLKGLAEPVEVVSVPWY